MEPLADHELQEPGPGLLDSTAAAGKALRAAMQPALLTGLGSIGPMHTACQGSCDCAMPEVQLWDQGPRSLVC